MHPATPARTTALEGAERRAGFSPLDTVSGVSGGSFSGPVRIERSAKRVVEIRPGGALSRVSTSLDTNGRRATRYDEVNR